MAVCNTFKYLSKKTGTFLTFSQYMEDLTIWQTESKHYKVVPSRFIAIDCRPNRWTNHTLPKLFQEYFENACACFKNSNDVEWVPEYSKTLFWNMMFGSSKSEDETDDMEVYNVGLIDISDIKYVGDINLQSYNTVDGMGYSEIYCHIPNDAPAYEYSMITDNFKKSHVIEREQNDILEGYQYGELNGRELLSLYNNYHYKLDKDYIFSWEDDTITYKKLQDSSYNINMIVVLYDVESSNGKIYKDIPLGIYLTGLIDDNTGEIKNSITKYVSNEDIYNSGTSYGLRICSRYVVAENENNYVVKDVTIEDNNYGDLSRVLSQLSISQNKMDEVVNRIYNTDKNYKNLLAIFKNSRTNVPYIKVINDESCWFVNGKMIGPSITECALDAYSKDEMDKLLGLGNSQNQTFQIKVTATDYFNNYIFERGSGPYDIIVKWDAYYGGKKVRPTIVKMNDKDYSDTSQITISNVTETTTYEVTAIYNGKKATTTAVVSFVDPIYFGEIIGDISENSIMNLDKRTANTPEYSYEISSKNPSTPGHICYAYPSDFGELQYIIDNEGFVYYNSSYNNDKNLENDSINSFKLETQIINGVEYYVYIDKNAAQHSKQIIKFKK